MVALVFLLSLTTNLFAGESLTWDACVKEVLANNFELKTARENLSVYEYKKKALWSEYLPTVSAGINADRGNSDTSTSLDASSYSGSLNVSQNIFSGFGSLGKTRQAEANYEGQEASYKSVRAQISYDLQTAFAQFLYAQDYVKLTQNIIKRREDNLNLVQLRFEGGMENKGSLLLSKASLDDAKFENSQAQHLLEIARQQLAKVLGRKSLSEEVQLLGDVPMNEPEKRVDMEAIASQTPEYQIAKSQVKASDAGLTIARSNFYPSLDFTGSTSKQGNTWPLRTNQWSVMLGLTVPLFNGGRDWYSTSSSSSMLSASMFAQEDTNLQIILKLKQAYNNFLDSIERVKVYKLYVEAASTRSKIARGKYNNGLLSFENWDIIENDLISREKTAVQTFRDRKIAEANWLMAQGRGIL